MEYKYHTDVTWKGEHLGEVRMGNGPVMAFSAPPDAHGHEGVLTPEDAFVAAVNTCIMMMFLWACERFKIDLVSYDCHAEGTKQIALDRTETFTRVVLRPRDRGAGRQPQADRAGAGIGPEVQPGGALDHKPTGGRAGNHHRGVSTMPDIKILGPGCANCYRLEGLAVAVLELMAEASPAR